MIRAPGRAADVVGGLTTNVPLPWRGDVLEVRLCIVDHVDAMARDMIGEGNGGGWSVAHP